jgi:hypothetical protein
VTAKPWIVHHREGWCALPPGAVPDPDAWNDPTLCGYVVTMRGGSRRGTPDCPECLAKLNDVDQVAASPAAGKESQHE